MALSDIQVQSLIDNNVWHDGCPVSPSSLVVLKVPYYDFEGFAQIGEIMVLDTIAPEVLKIFEELHQLRFPIESLTLMDEFGGDDVKSMESNNSSAFNGRKVMNTNRWSSHAFGVAIDINPAQNPYMILDRTDSTIKVYPSSAISYVNRGIKKAGMVEEIVSIFANHGFTEWGGNWELKPDYHHFQLPWDRIKEMFPEV